MHSESDFLYISELKLPRSTVYAANRKDLLPIHKLGSRSIVLRSDYEKFLQNLPLRNGPSESHAQRARQRWAAGPWGRRGRGKNAAAQQ